MTIELIGLEHIPLVKKGDDISNYFSKVRKYFEDDDISIGNMEVVITDGNMEISGSNYNQSK